MTSAAGCNVWGELYGGVIRIQRQARDVARLQAELLQSIRVGPKSSNLDSLLRMLLFKGIRHAGKVLEFGSQVQPVVASHGRFEGGLNFSPLGQSSC